MTVAVLAGLLVGLGAWLAWLGLRPAPEPLGAALARLEREPPGPAAGNGVAADRDTRLGRLLLDRVPPLAQGVERVRADLRIVGRSPEEHAARIGAYTLVTVLMGPWFAFVALVFDINLPMVVPLSISVLGASWSIFRPFLQLRREARARRVEFAYALSCWCDVAIMSLAAGRGVEQAMETAARAGRGWAFAELRGALRGGYVQGATPWEALTTLGHDLGVSELSELASTTALAGEEGAAVRSTLAAKARTIRERITSDAEVKAASATERMSLPSVLLVIGFLVFLAFPALMTMFEGTR